MDAVQKLPRKGMSGNALKVIAMVSMLIDHIGAALIEIGVLKCQDQEAFKALLLTPYGKMWGRADLLLRMIGRLAFPILCFLLVEGFLHTRDVKRYLGRLLLFALISEIPFDLAFHGTWFYKSYQNVYFTLFLGLLLLVWYQKAGNDPLRQLLAILACGGASVLLRCDYNLSGLMLILIFYIFRNNEKARNVVGGLLCLIESMPNLGAAVLAFVPIKFYNGARGNKSWKYVFYWFYPIHLTLLYLLRLIIF